MRGIGDIQKVIHQDDTVLDAVIQEFMDSPYYLGSETTVAGFRTAEYIMLRIFSYPKSSEYNDANIKINSGIPELVAEGQAQLAAYVQECLDVKTRFPKE